jgi:hypothetical protein
MRQRELWRQCLPLVLPNLSCSTAVKLRAVSKQSCYSISNELLQLSSDNMELLCGFPHVTSLKLHTM